MNATAKLSKQGNSTGVTLSKDVLDAVGWQRGQEITVSVVGDHIELRASGSVHEKALASARRCFARYPTALKKLAE